MERIIQLNDAKRTEMGRNGRDKMELEFDEQIVIQQYFAVIKECL